MINIKDITKYFKTIIEKKEDKTKLYVGLILICLSVFLLVSIIFESIIIEINVPCNDLQIKSITNNADMCSMHKSNICYFAFILLLPLLAYGLYTISNYKWEEKKSGIIYDLDIYSIKNSNSIKGNFFLGTGTINSFETYIFFKKGNFGYIKDYVYSSNIEIIFRNDIKPSYKQIVIDGEVKEFIFVPKNTIKMKFDLS